MSLVKSENYRFVEYPVPNMYLKVDKIYIIFKYDINKHKK